MHSTRRAAIERETQGRRALERHFSEETPCPADDLHREMGERLTAGVMGVLDMLANLGSRNTAQIDPSAFSALVRQAMGEELQSLRSELQELRTLLEEIRAGINRIDKFTMQRLLGIDTSQPDALASPLTAGAVPQPALTASIPERSLSGRAPRVVVIDRVLNTAQRLEDEGVDITQMTSTALAHEAGVKPTQFTYAFKTRDNFLAQFRDWQSKETA